MIYNYNGIRINYNDSGDGELIVLLHGYLETSAIWDSFAEKLSRSFRVVSIDLPGHGGSESFSENHSMDFIATVIRELMEDLGAKKFFLAGHSMGGYVTLAFADLFPASLSGFCLFHSQPFPDTPETIEKRKAEIELVREGKRDLFVAGNITRMYATQSSEKFRAAIERSVNLAAEIPDEGIVAVLNGMIERPSRLAVMQSGAVPCLWILGEADNYIPCSAMQGRVTLAKNSRLVVLKNSGHMGFIEEEEQSLKIFQDFIFFR
jgi:pimeloyl-ACP methyl ester carboxylesterase